MHAHSVTSLVPPSHPLISLHASFSTQFPPLFPPHPAPRHIPFPPVQASPPSLSPCIPFPSSLLPHPCPRSPPLICLPTVFSPHPSLHIPFPTLTTVSFRHPSPNIPFPAFTTVSFPHPSPDIPFPTVPSTHPFPHTCHSLLPSHIPLSTVSSPHPSCHIPFPSPLPSSASPHSPPCIPLATSHSPQSSPLIPLTTSLSPQSLPHIHLTTSHIPSPHPSHHIPFPTVSSPHPPLHSPLLSSLSPHPCPPPHPSCNIPVPNPFSSSAPLHIPFPAVSSSHLTSHSPLASALLPHPIPHDLIPIPFTTVSFTYPLPCILLPPPPLPPLFHHLCQAQLDCTVLDLYKWTLTLTYVLYARTTTNDNIKTATCYPPFLPHLSPHDSVIIWQCHGIIVCFSACMQKLMAGKTRVWCELYTTTLYIFKGTKVRFGSFFFLKQACLMLSCLQRATVRDWDPQEVGGGGGGGYVMLQCHHQNDSCIKMGSYESQFNVSLIVGDNCINITQARKTPWFWMLLFCVQQSASAALWIRTACLAKWSNMTQASLFLPFIGKEWTSMAAPWGVQS